MSMREKCSQRIKRLLATTGKRSEHLAWWQTVVEWFDKNDSPEHVPTWVYLVDAWDEEIEELHHGIWTQSFNGISDQNA